ncbi:MAG: hypothetical protein KKH01_07990 [Firmicutes bacterium]|nr:hypothetical protein [Bacillota bacterium]
MGAWGVKLYQDDVTEDVKTYYVDHLKRGLDSDELAQNMLSEFADYIDDEEDGPLFWFALADTQWKYGRLLPFVKEKALEYLNSGSDLKRWQEDGKLLKQRIIVLDELKQQLTSPQPPEKKVSQYRLFNCEWKIGDVYAYKFESDISKERGFFNKYIVFQKVRNGIWWPGHTEPVVRVYKWIGEEMPETKAILDLEVLPQFFIPKAYAEHRLKDVMFEMMLISTSKRSIPKNLTNLGNILPIQELNRLGSGSRSCYWKNFEEEITKSFLNWESYNVYDLLDGKQKIVD